MHYMKRTNHITSVSSSTILEFASLQIQNSPFGLRQLDLRPFRFTENGYQKFFNVRSRDMGNSP